MTGESWVAKTVTNGAPKYSEVILEMSDMINAHDPFLSDAAIHGASMLAAQQKLDTYMEHLRDHQAQFEEFFQNSYPILTDEHGQKRFLEKEFASSESEYLEVQAERQTDLRKAARNLLDAHLLQRQFDMGDSIRAREAELRDCATGYGRISAFFFPNTAAETAQRDSSRAVDALKLDPGLTRVLNRDMGEAMKEFAEQVITGIEGIANKYRTTSQSLPNH